MMRIAFKVFQNYTILEHHILQAELSGLFAAPAIALERVLLLLVQRDHDITDVLVDATLKIGGRDYQALAAFLKKVSELSKISDQDFTFTISADESELPKEIFEYCEKI